MKSILLVDDKIEILSTVSNVLNQYDYTVIISNTVNKAIELLNQLKIDCVIIDVNLGNNSLFNGFDLVHELLNINYNGKIVVMTGYSDYNTNLDIKKRINLFIKKPFQLPVLIDWLKDNI